MIARQAAPWDPAAWAAPGSGDVILTLATLLYLGLAFLLPLHSGVLNLGLYAQFLAGFAVAALVSRLGGIDPSARAGVAALAGTGAGALVGAIIVALKWRFAIHEVLSGILLGGALAPAARALPLTHAVLPALTLEAASLPGAPPWAPGLGLPGSMIVAGGLVALAVGALIALSFAHALRASAAGFDLRIVGSNPLAAVAAGVDVERAQLLVLLCGGACAGLAGALQIWSHSSAALERWPLPLAFAGLAVAIYGMGTVRGLLLASLLFTAWLSAPGTPVFLARPGWSAAVAGLLLLPALWALPRPSPDQGAPRALWRTRHRETH
jgi:simple sugar transport system permease protein